MVRKVQCILLFFVVQNNEKVIEDVRRELGSVANFNGMVESAAEKLTK